MLPVLAASAVVLAWSLLIGPVFAAEPEVEVVGVLSPPRGDRQITQPPSGACQLLYGTNHNNATTFDCLDDFRPTRDGAIGRVTWAGVYRKGTSTATFAGARPPSSIAGGGDQEPGTGGVEQFEISFYRSNGAEIVLPAISRQIVTIGPGQRVVDPQAITVGTVTFTIYDYDVTLPAPVPVLSTQCYAIQIRAVCETQFDGSFTNPSSQIPGYQFRWMRAMQGNGLATQQASVGNPFPCPPAPPTFFGGGGSIAADFAYCLDVPFDRGVPCRQVTTCQQAAARTTPTARTLAHPSSPGPRAPTTLLLRHQRT